MLTDPLAAAMLTRLRQMGDGAVASPRTFADLAARTAIDKALSRLTAACTIRRVARGLYDIPRPSRRGGILSPSLNAVIRAVAARDRIRVQIAGAAAAHRLGLTARPPAAVVVLTDGVPRTLRVGARTITFRHAAPRYIAPAGRTSGLIIQALRWLGRARVDDAVVRQLRAALDAPARRQFQEDAAHAPAWIVALMKRVEADDDGRDGRV